MTKTAIPLYQNCGLCLAEKEGFSRPRRQPSPPRDDSRPRSEGKVFLLVARQNPFTERILTAPPRRRRSGSNPPKSQKAPQKRGAVCQSDGGIFTPAQATKPSVRWRLPSPREQGFPACRTSKSVHRKDFDGSPTPPSLGFKSSQIQKSTPKMGCLFVAEKEGFEPSRRLPGLHP